MLFVIITAAAVVILGLLVSVVSAGPALADSQHTVTYGSGQSITEHGICKTVTNWHSSGLSIMVPTNTSTEWASFYNSPPSGVSAVDCGFGGWYGDGGDGGYYGDGGDGSG